MRDLTRALNELRDTLAYAQHEISILEQITGELKAIVDRCDDGRIDGLVDCHFGEIDSRMAKALSRHASATRVLDECRRERGGRSQTNLEGLTNTRSGHLTQTKLSAGKTLK